MPPSFLRGKPAIAGLWKEAYLPSPGGSSSSCSLGEGSRGCRGSMLMMSCLFKEWELRLWEIFVLKTDTSQRELVSIRNTGPFISVDYPSWPLPVDSHSASGQWERGHAALFILKVLTCLLMTMCANATQWKIISPHMFSDLDMLCDKTRHWKKTWETEIHKRRYHRTRYADKWMEGMAQSNLTTTKTHKNKNSAQKMAQAIYSWELFWCCWMSNIYYQYLIFPLKFTLPHQEATECSSTFSSWKKNMCVGSCNREQMARKLCRLSYKNYWRIARQPIYTVCPLICGCLWWVFQHPSHIHISCPN